MRSPNYLAAVILFLYPAIAIEMLSGDCPLSGYFNPVGFAVLNITYGGALLLMRETIVRWKKDFPSMVAFALGYGILNEALCSKGFFDPHFYSATDFGLEGFGRVFGINVPWAIDISVVHMAYSILVPYTLITILFPGKERWIGNKLYAVVMVLLIFVTIISFTMFHIAPSYYHYDEGPGPLLLILFLMTLLILAAWKMPNIALEKWNVKINLLLLFLSGVAYAVGFILLPSLVGKVTHSPMTYELFLLLFFIALPIFLLIKLPLSTDLRKAALCAGLLSTWLTMGILQHKPSTLFGAVVVMAVLAAVFKVSMARQKV